MFSEHRPAGTIEEAGLVPSFIFFWGGEACETNSDDRNESRLGTVPGPQPSLHASFSPPILHTHTFATH